MTGDLIPTERILNAILNIRGQRAILDADLAALYGVSTKVLNQAVKRNIERFPPDFMFSLTPTEKAEVVTNCDHLSRLRFSPSLPNAFTEHGALMAANILRSDRAIRTSIQIIRTFIQMREAMASHADLARKLNTLEKKYDDQFKVVFDAIRQLMMPPEKPRRRVGFEVRERKAAYHVQRKGSRRA
jgi:hypothetical protein